MIIWWLTDGKAGHVAQAKGLFAALTRQSTAIPPRIIDIPVEQCRYTALVLYWLTQGRMGSRPQAVQQAAFPDVIVGIGHQTHGFLWLLGQIYPQAKTLVIMRPSLPLSVFDLVMVPAHDGVVGCERVLLTQGALNPLTNQQRHCANRTLIMIGGPSKRYGFDSQALLSQLSALVAQAHDQAVVLTTSRRTPADFLPQLNQQPWAHQVQICPVEQTPQGWVFEQLQQAQNVWVTEDSVSMLYESLTAGCRVGVLRMPVIRQDRITQSIEQLLDDGLIGGRDGQYDALPDPIELQEADRAAIWLNSHLQPAKQNVVT